MNERNNRGEMIKEINNRVFNNEEIRNSTRSSDFETMLFWDGQFVFDHDFEVYFASKEISEERHKLKSEYGRRGYEDKMKSFIEEKRHDIAWKREFSEKIPKKWKDLRNICKDFKKAKERNIQLSDTLIDAALSHYHPDVVKSAGVSQKLSKNQLALVIARLEVGTVYPWNYEQILEAQVMRGLTREGLDNSFISAGKLVENYMNKPEEDSKTFMAAIKP